MNNQIRIKKQKRRMKTIENISMGSSDQEIACHLLKCIKYPLITEKTVTLYNKGYYTFLVDRTLTKIEIKYILQKVLQVTITDLNTCILPIKTRRVGKFVGKRTRYKKVYIKIKEGQTIVDLLT